MTSGINDPLAKSTDFVLVFRLALRRRKTSQEKGMIGASLGGTRTALGELEAAF
jgi:hypothetical protein